MPPKNHNWRLPAYLLPTQNSASRSSITSEKNRKITKPSILPHQYTDQEHWYHSAKANTRERDDAPVDLKMEGFKGKKTVQASNQDFTGLRDVCIGIHVGVSDVSRGTVTQYNNFRSQGAGSYTNQNVPMRQRSESDSLERKYDNKLSSHINIERGRTAPTFSKRHSHESKNEFKVPDVNAILTLTQRNLNSYTNSLHPNADEYYSDISKDFGQRQDFVQMSEPVENLPDEFSLLQNTVRSQSDHTMQTDEDNRNVGKEKKNNVTNQKCDYVGAPLQLVADTATALNADRKITHQNWEPAEISEAGRVQWFTGNAQTTDGKKDRLDKGKWNGARPKQMQTRIQREWSREEDIAKCSVNLKFYKNEMKSKPWGIKIEDMLNWRGDYQKQENNDSYIQWLFPTQNYSEFNSYAQPIEIHEAEEIKATPELKERFLRAYMMILDFYGMELRSEVTGEVQRCQKNFKERFIHLNRSTHNFNRITRILIALGIFGFEHFQAPWLFVMLQERFKFQTLPDIPFGVMYHWIGSVQNDYDRGKMLIEFTMISENTHMEFQTHTLSSASHGAQDNIQGHSAKAQLTNMMQVPNAHLEQDEKINQKVEGLELGSDDYDNELLLQLQKNAQDSRRQRPILQAQVVAPLENGDIRKVKDKEGRNVNLTSTFSDKNNKQGSVRSAKDIDLEMDTSDLGTEKTPNQDEQERKTDHRMPGRSDSTESDTNNDTDVRKPSNKTDIMCSNRQCTGEDDGRSVILKFYKNEVASEPSGSKIDEMLKWKGDYATLERNHFYIPWLFPTGEYSNTNSYAELIQHHEAEKIRADPELKERFLRAYTMMLDFYGMELMSEKTGEVQRCQQNFRERIEHLNKSKHNWLRITRILTALGIFGFEHYQAPWVSFMMQEIYVQHTLPGIDVNALQHWIDAISKDDDKTTLEIKLVEFATNSN